MAQASTVNRHFLALALLLTVAILFGGGGSPSPFTELVVQLCAIAAVVFVVALPGPSLSGPSLPESSLPAGSARGARRVVVMWSLCAVWAALFIAQLIPLPSSVWQAMGGRTAMADALAALGKPAVAWPLSVSPRSTLVSLLSLIPPFAIVFLVGRVGPDGRNRILALVVALGLLAALVGAVQLSSGDSHALRFYADTHYGVITGFQANRNAAADVFLIALVAAAGLHVSAGGRGARRDGKATALASVRIAAILIFAVAILLTASRTGVALLGGALLALVLYVLLRMEWTRRTLAMTAAVLLAAGCAAVLLASNNVLGHGIWHRIVQGAGERSLMWNDAAYVAKLVWPWGSGMGTFQPIFLANEQLEAVNMTVPNRAHNDYLELAIEAGAPGLVLLAITLGFLIWCVFAPRRRADMPIDIGHRIFAAGVLLVVALHSIVEYPLRSMSIACLTALAGGLVCSFALPNKIAEDKVSA